MPSKTQQKILEIIAEQAIVDVGDLSLDQSLDNLGIDSLALVESIFAIEEAFDIDIPFNANAPEQSDFDLSTIGSIVGAVEKLVVDQTP